MAHSRRYVFGRADDVTHPSSLRAALAELISTAIFVFAAEGSALALGKMCVSPTSSTAESLVLVALAHALALFVAVAVAMNISGGHVNPAVTLGALVGGRISLLRAVLYCVAQLLGATLGCLLLMSTTGGMKPLGFELSMDVPEGHAVLLEAVMTFGLVYTFFATVIDGKRGNLITIAPLAIGLIVGANILVGGPFDGAAMNPARVFGPALVGWQWSNHWIYWIGPFIGAAIAGLVYEFLVMPAEAADCGQAHQPLVSEEY